MPDAVEGESYPMFPVFGTHIRGPAQLGRSVLRTFAFPYRGERYWNNINCLGHQPGRTLRLHDHEPERQPRGRRLRGKVFILPKPEVCRAREESAVPPTGRELLRVVISHRSSRARYKPFRKSRGWATASGPPPTNATLSAERVRAPLSSPAGTPPLVKRGPPGGCARLRRGLRPPVSHSRSRYWPSPPSSEGCRY